MKDLRRADREGITQEEQTQELRKIQSELDRKLLPNSFMNEQKEGLIDHQMLKKYLIYAKRFIRPRLNDIDN